MIKLNNHSKQLAVPFKIYTDFQSILKGIQKGNRDGNPSYIKNIKIIFLAVLLIKSCALMIDLANQWFSTEVKMRFIGLLQIFLMSKSIVKGW